MPKQPSNPAASPGQSSALIRLESLSVSFGRQQVLRQLSLEIPRGQTLAVIGESGCGKTVLLKCLIGLIRPTRGKVEFDGQDLQTLSARALADQRRRFGFVFQNAALFDSLTVAQNISFPLREHGRYSREDVDRIVLEKLALVGLPPAVVTKRPAELSGGMRKRVGLARALAAGPEVMLYDEPTTGLDPIMSDVINELIIRTRKQSDITSILVTHDMRTALKVADRVVMLFPLSRLQEGEEQIVFDGTPKEIAASSSPRVAQFVRGEARERLQEMDVMMA